MPSCFVLFDGECPACNRFVAWIAAADGEARLAFAALQSPLGQRVLQRLQLPADYGDSIIVVTAQGVMTHADAFAALGRVTRFPGNLLRLAGRVPHRLFAAGYGWLGRRRRRLPLAACPVMPAGLQARFVIDRDAQGLLWQWCGASEPQRPAP